MASNTDLQVDLDTVTRLLIDDWTPGEDHSDFLLDALAAATDDALRVLSDHVESHTAQGGSVDARLAALRGKARNRETKAAVALIAARAAEGAGDSATARDLIDEALGWRPGLEPALHDGAQYAAARGDYVTADRYLRRSEVPSPLQPGLTEALSVTAENVPRNNPCPCGSGRKFKACCRRDGAPPLKARAQLLYALLGTYAERAPGLDVIRPLMERTEDPERCGMFCLDLALFPGGLLERFLAARGDWLRPDEHDLIERWRQIPVGLYEILEVRRNSGVTLRELPDGAPVELNDELFSLSAERLELFCGRLLCDDTGPRMLAMPVHIFRHRRRALQDLLASTPTVEQIADFLGPEPAVQLRNSDGEDLHDCAVTYRVAHADQVFDQLSEELTRTGAHSLGRHRQLPDGRTLSLGQMSLAGQDITITANSPSRLTDLEATLRALAPDAVEQDRRAERLSPDPDGRKARAVVKESYLLSGDSAGSGDRKSEDRVARAAEAAWLDTPGVIGDLSPREAAAHADAAVRAELLSTIDDVEATLLQTRRAGLPTTGLMDPARLREALLVSTD